MNSILRTILLPLTLGALLTGCVGSGALPEQRFYRLPEPRPTPVANPVITRSLGIPRLRANGLYHERALLHFVPEQPLDLRPYHYHHWSDSPTLLIRDHLASYLGAAGAVREISRFQDEGRAEQKLYGRLIRFEREVTTTRIVVHIALEFSLDAGHQVLLPAKRYEVRQEAADRTVHSTVQAFGTALEAIYGELLADLRTVTR
ncbi:MAG: hypothetical protein DWQ09_00145 [Proteobacteria bacterium]|nr:MAG: hypothetical protein DWQ09_00145 [Pseudomonadota bacterium]